MSRRSARTPLNVFLNNRHVGRLTRQSSGAIDFAYDESWLEWEYAIPVSLSLPLRKSRYLGDPVIAVFENLLPDSRAIRTRVAERVGAKGTADGADRLPPRSGAGLWRRPWGLETVHRQSRNPAGNAEIETPGRRHSHMTIASAIRQIHRWIGILFTLTVAAGFIVPAVSPGAEWVYYLPLTPLAVLLFSGLYLFARPYLRRVSHGR